MKISIKSWIKWKRWRINSRNAWRIKSWSQICRDLFRIVRKTCLGPITSCIRTPQCLTFKLLMQHKMLSRAIGTQQISKISHQLHQLKKPQILQLISVHLIQTCQLLSHKILVHFQNPKKYGGGSSTLFLHLCSFETQKRWPNPSSSNCNIWVKVRRQRLYTQTSKESFSSRRKQAGS